MIQNFGNKAAKQIYHQQFVKHLPKNVQQEALHKMIIIDTVANINDLRTPPSNHLEKLRGNMKDYYSLRINNQYRICFKVIKPRTFIDVSVEDYH